MSVRFFAALRLSILLLTPSCVDPDPSTGRIADGEACERNDQCRSNACLGKLCAGSTCSCPLGGCSDRGSPSEGCERGWLCDENPLTIIFGQGICRRSCDASCPEFYRCEDQFCRFDAPPPAVTATVSNARPRIGEVVRFSATAESELGVIERYVWVFRVDDIAEGQTVERAFDEAGRYTVDAYAEDSVNATGSARVEVDVCFREREACPEQTSCCDALICMQDARASSTFSCAVCGEAGRPCNPLGNNGRDPCCAGLQCLPVAENELGCVTCRPEGAPCSRNAIGQCCDGLRCASGPGLGDICTPI